MGLALAAAGLLTFCSAAEPRRPAGLDPAKVRRAALKAAAGNRHDDPEAAEKYARAKRLEGSSIADPLAAWDRAVARREAMPPHSLVREGSPLASAKAHAPARWESVGPGNIGGRTRVLLIDPTDPRILYAAGVSGGVWKSTDEGGSWTAVGDALTNIAVNALAMDPSDSSILYAGTGEGYFREDVRGTWLPLRGGGIFVTVDGGTNWSRLGSTAGENFHWVNDLAISRQDSGRIYAATRTGVWRSADGGESWEHVLATDVKGGCLDLAMREDATGDFVFAACGTFEPATVYRNVAAEGIEPWEPVLTRSEMGRTTLAIAPSQPEVVYAVSASNVAIGGSPPQGLFAVFRSDEAGAAGSWNVRVRGDDPEILHRLLLTNPIAALTPECFDVDEPRFWVTMGWYCNVAAVDPVDADTVWVGGVDLFRSNDGGRSWAAASHWAARGGIGSYVHADQHGIAFHPAFDGEGNRTMYAVNDGGVFRTEDARAALIPGVEGACNPAASAIEWRSLNHGFGVTQFYHGAVFPDGRAWLGGTQDNGTILGREEWGSDGWRRIYGGDGGYVAIDPTNPNRIWAETQWGGIVRSASGGESFQSSYPGGEDDEFLFITPFTLDPRNPERLWTGGSRLLRSDDRGRNWHGASVPLSGGLVSAVAVSPHDSDLVFAGTTAGRIQRTDRGTSANDGTVWSGSSPRSGFVSSLAFHPFDSRVVFATYAGFGGRHVWRSADGGGEWEPIDGDGDGELPDIPVHSIVVDPRDSMRLYIGTDLGVFVSLDGGASWMPEREGMPAAVTEALVLSRVGTELTLYAFTHGRGAWRVDLGSVVRRRGARR